MSKPTTLFWNGVTPRAKSEDLEKPLQAEIRDPLWMICRQWQFGEFMAEDAALPALARIKYEETFPTLAKDKDQNPARNETPLNPMIESNPFDLDMSLRVEIGLHWVKMLRRKLKNSATILDKFYANEVLHFKSPKTEGEEQKFDSAEVLSQPEFLNFLSFADSCNAIDGAKLLTIIINETSLTGFLFPNDPINPEVDQLGQELLDWSNKVYGLSFSKFETWQKERLEYQFNLSANDNSSHQSQLKAEEYWGEQINWYQFDLDIEKQTANAEFPNQYKEVVHIPSQVSYVGMPKTRWWEMEDSAVNFGNIKTTTDNPTRLLFTQFNLVYGNDWFLLPLVVEIGAMTRIEEIIVKDNFGFRTKINPTPKDADSVWNFFNVHNLGNGVEQRNWLCFPKAISAPQRSEPVEEVHFIRDEMANMVWAIEKEIPNPLGGAQSGSEAATALQGYLKELAKPEEEFLPNNAKVSYQMASTVPENWIPFVPVKLRKDITQSRQIQLQRASMPRIVNGFKPLRVRPRTSILSEGLNTNVKKPFYIHEEEIPRAGIMVRGRWKRARWLNGKTYVWYAREKTVGRGEGHSGLKFDYLEDKSLSHSVRETKNEGPELLTGKVNISFGSNLPETWSMFLAPDLTGFTERYYPVDFEIREDAFPSDLYELKIQNVAIHFVTKDGLPPMAIRLNIGQELISSHMVYDGKVDSWSGDPQERWENIIGQSPISTWRLAVPNNDTVWGWFKDGIIENIELTIYYEAKPIP